MTQEVNNLSLLYEPKSHTEISFMHESNSGPRLYNRIMKRNICLQNYNFYKFKTELTYINYCKTSLFETQLYK